MSDDWRSKLRTRVVKWSLIVSLMCTLFNASLTFADDKTLQINTTINKQSLLPGHKYSDALRITVTDQSGTSVKAAEVTVKVTDGKIKLYRDPTRSPDVSVNGQTDSEGILDVSIDTTPIASDKGDDFELEIAAAQNGQNGKVTIKEQVLSGFTNSFHSRRVASEVFIGNTFTTKYDDQGNSQGFNRSDFLGRLSVDTLWAMDPRVHTGVEMMFSSFPSEKKTQPGQPTTIEFADSFSGAVRLLWQPTAMAVYPKTSMDADLRYDALRLGVLAKVGMLTRETQDINGDSDIFHWGLGLSFTHHQTNISDPRQDSDNVVPVRFVEVLYEKYEEFAGTKRSNRIVVDAGFRLASLAKGAAPLYAGLHLNGGEGKDDIRIFAGLLFNLDKVSDFLGL